MRFSFYTMLESLTNWGYQRHLQIIKDQIYAAKMVKYDLNKKQQKRNSGGRIRIFSSGYTRLMSMGGRWGARFGHRRQKLAEREGRLRLYGPISFILTSIVVFSILSAAISLFNPIFSLIFGGPIVNMSKSSSLVLYCSGAIAAVPNLYARRLAKKEVKLTKQLERAINQEPIKHIDLAIQNLGHHQERVQRTAVIAAANALKESPGKAIKNSSMAPDVIYNKLIHLLQSSDNVNITKPCLVALKWISRDYGHLPYQNADIFTKLVKSKNSQIQVNSTVILGNIDWKKNQERETCAAAIKPAVEDPDADVRKAAAYALANIPCDPSIKLLNRLAEDPDPDVRQTAAAKLDQLL